MIIAHLSDLHLRNRDDAAVFSRQLDRITARGVEHLAITGDLLDRWNPPLLEHILDLLAGRGLMQADRLTIIHGNHDLTSSGGYPRARSDLWRLVGRLWDPPPLLTARRRAFYRVIARRASSVALSPQSIKTVGFRLRLAALDSVVTPWRPVGISRGVMTLRHTEGGIPSGQIAWLADQRGSTPLIVLLHHYPLPIEPYEWKIGRAFGSRHPLLARLQKHHVAVRMEIDPDDRAAFWSAADSAGVSAVLCGHVHRARLEWHERVAVCLNGQSGAAWAGHTIAYYLIEGGTISVEHETVPSPGTEHPTRTITPQNA